MVRDIRNVAFPGSAEKRNCLSRSGSQYRAGAAEGCQGALQAWGDVGRPRGRWPPGAAPHLTRLAGDEADKVRKRTLSWRNAARTIRMRM
ncbi:hypothetical protein GCM10023205_34160 [Yinghuangia aomiensis]|uniref:Uncharacterized protein n=1 Tax=Yinghuangia aomiensis TaxID=676205 RepID=A0ABP9HBP5_9ACTN